MGLVDYSDSESDNDSPQTSTPAKAAAAPPAKKSFQKLVDKTNPGKILVNLPSASTADDAAPSGEPAAKRIKTGGSRFSGFSSFLPPPKAITKPAPSGASGSKGAPKVGVNLKTSSEAAFSREDPAFPGDDGLAEENGFGGSGLKLPPPKASGPSPAQPSIPDGQKPAEEVKLVGKPMMFRPLSVARKPGKKNGAKTPAAPKPAHTVSAASEAAIPSTEPSAGPPPKKISLFSIGDETPAAEAAPQDTASYEPEFASYDSTYLEDMQSHVAQQAQYANYTQTFSASNADPNSLDTIADDLDLDPVARRELFGRGGGGSKATAKPVINFNLDREYQHNQELRASGALDAQQHNPVRAIKAGKHTLQQLINQVQTQRDALEESFAKNRATQRQAGAKYGFR